MSETKVILQSSDKEDFEVDMDIIKHSRTVSEILGEDSMVGNRIPLPNVNSKVLAKVLEFCTHHKDKVDAANVHRSEQENRDYLRNIKLSEWDQTFLNGMDQPLLFEVVMASNYLVIPLLHAYTAVFVAQQINGKSTEEIRKMFNIKNDFTPEEEEVVNSDIWSFEDAPSTDRVFAN